MLYISIQAEKLRKANEDLRERLGAKENAVRDLSKDFDKAARDRYRLILTSICMHAETQQ